MMKIKRNNILSIWMLMATLVLPLITSCVGGGGSAVDEFLSVSQGGGADNGDPGVGNSALSFTPAAFDFGDVGVGGTGTQSFTITNTSALNVFFSSFSGTNATFSTSASTCAGSMPPGATCTFNIDFNPSSGGLHTITINTLYGLTLGDTSLISPLGVQGSAGANAPSNYQLTAVTATTADISWTDNSSNETGFEVERCDGLTCATTFVAATTTTIASNSTSHQFTGLTEGSYYRFRVRAVTATSQSNWLEGSSMLAFGGITSIDDNGTGTADISTLDCRTVGEGAYVTLSWNAVAGATNYFIYDTSGGSNTLLKTVTAPATNTILTGLTINTAYSLLVTVATSTGFNSVNSGATALTTTDFLPCIILGKSDPAAITTGTGFKYPSDVKSLGTKLFVADRVNHRVLIWNTLPSSTSDMPDVVVGQATLGQNYVNNTPGNPGTPSAKSLYDPYGIWVGNVAGTDRLIVADFSNHRVLIWNGIPTSNHQSADLVLGQGNFLTNVADSGDVTRGMQNPISVTSDGTKLYVADFNNDRVLIWNTFPTASFQKPDVYLGQNSDTGQTGACNVSNIVNQPRGVWSDGTTLLVANSACNRVSVYSPVPTAGNPDPDTILGNTGLTASGAGAGSASVNLPWDVAMNGGKVFVTDYNNNRIKVWNALPAAGNHGVASDYVVGFSNTASTGGLTQDQLDNPIGFAFNGTKLFVADNDNHRIMGYNTVPLGSGSNADFQIGQEDFFKEVINYSDPIGNNNFDYSNGLAYDGTQFFAADVSRNRILVWNSIPTSYNQPADFVIGQGNFTTQTSGRSQSQLNGPRGICTGAGKLWVPDYNNRRIMVFDLPIVVNAPNAEAVLGQTTWAANTTGAGLDRVNSAIACYHDGTSLFVSDYTYDRILIWSPSPAMVLVTDNPAADVRIGTDTGNLTSQIGLRDVWGMYSDGSKLFVADSNNHRIMVWDPIPTVDDTPASFHLGGGSTWATRSSGVSSVLMNYPTDVTGDGAGKIYVLDQGNGRIIAFDSPVSTNDPATEIYGKDNFTNSVETWDNSLSISSETRGLLWTGNRVFFGDYRHSRVMGFPVKP